MTALELTRIIAAFFNLVAAGEEDALDALTYATDQAEVIGDPIETDALPADAVLYQDIIIQALDHGFVLTMEDGDQFHVMVRKTKGD